MAVCDARLLDLMLGLFTASELRIFLLELDDGSLLRALPGLGATEQDVHFQALLALQHRGLVNGALFDRLGKARPACADQIEAVRALWSGARPEAPPPAPAARAASLGEVGRWTPPLVVVVAWHERFGQGAAVARRLHDRWSRDPAAPLEPGPGVPVFFLTSPSSDGPAVEAMIAGASRVAVVLLVDEELQRDEAWRAWATGLVARSQERPGWRVHPVALHQAGLGFVPELRGRHFLRLYDEPAERRDAVLDLWLTHELCRQLRDQRRVVDGMIAGEERDEDRLVLLLGYTGHDERALAAQLRRRIEDESPLRAFLKVRELDGRAGWEASVQAELDRAVLLAIVGDSSASSPGCHEVLLRAKRAGRPVVVLDLMHLSEARSFPYLGNAATLRMRAPDAEAGLSVIDAVLQEVFRHEHASLLLTSLQRSGWLPAAARLHPSPPELLTLLDEGGRGALTIHPDPPLARHERELLSASGHDVRTPASYTRLGRPVRVAISVSESEDLSARGLGAVHLQDALVELSRQLLAAGATLAYGGDLRAGGFSEVFRDLAIAHGHRLRQEQADARGPHLRWYLAWPYHLTLSADDERALLPHVRVRRGAEPAGGPPTAEADALSRMRDEMADESDARVLMGGRTRGWKGHMPGVFEEALATLRWDKPLYVVGAMGGGAACVGQVLRGERPAALAGVDEACLAEMAAHGAAGLNNGLTAAENDRLFTSPYLQEIIGLVLKGLGATCP